MKNIDFEAIFSGQKRVIHPLTKILNQFEIPIENIARSMGLTRSYCRDLLYGFEPVTKRNHEKFQAISVYIKASKRISKKNVTRKLIKKS